MNNVHKTIEIAGFTITIHELTVADIRAALKMEESDEDSPDSSDAVDMFLLEDISLPDICRMTDLTPEKIGDMKPSEIRKVADACRKVNSDFFSLRARVLKYVDLMALENIGVKQLGVPESV